MAASILKQAGRNSSRKPSRRWANIVDPTPLLESHDTFVTSRRASPIEITVIRVALGAIYAKCEQSLALSPSFSKSPSKTSALVQLVGPCHDHLCCRYPLPSALRDHPEPYRHRPQHPAIQICRDRQLCA